MITVDVIPVRTEIYVTPGVTEVNLSPPTTIVEVSSGIPRVDLKIDDNLAAADQTVDGLQVDLTAAENLAFGDICYSNGSGKWAKADATTEATARALVMAAETILADANGKFLLLGFARNDAWSWTVGAELYLSETAGGLTQVAPTTSNSVTLVLGTAISADRMYFKPSSNLIVHV